jgi:hypothetical protein
VGCGSEVSPSFMDSDKSQVVVKVRCCSLRNSFPSNDWCRGKHAHRRARWRAGVPSRRRARQAHGAGIDSLQKASGRHQLPGCARSRQQDACRPGALRSASNTQTPFKQRMHRALLLATSLTHPWGWGCAGGAASGQGAVGKSVRALAERLFVVPQGLQHREARASVP